MSQSTSINPATEAWIADHRHDDELRVDQALEAADASFQEWRRCSFEERGRPLREVAKRLREQAPTLARQMSEEMGKPVDQAQGEAEKCAWVCDYFADQAARFLAPEAIATDATASRVDAQPLGTIVGVMPWNFPFWQVFRFAAPTLMAGNAVILKHAPNVQGCAQTIARLFEEAGLPEGLFQSLHLPNERTEALLADKRVKGATLTGSVRAGRAVGAVLGRHLKPQVLELGGSDPFIVLDDADLQRALEVGAYARFMNNGQSCIAAKRFIVADAIYDDFVDGLAEAIDDMNVGDPLEAKTDIGPMARADLRDELHQQVRQSIDEGARCVRGGQPIVGDGFFYEPTLLADVRPGMPAFDEETFGPAAAVVRAADADEAIALANDSDFGLGASLWTTTQRAKALVHRLEAGAVFVNEMVKSDPRLPFGGIKDSGVGRELARQGIWAFVNTRTVYFH